MMKTYKNIELASKKRIVLIAHDNVKEDLIDWVTQHKDSLKNHELYATGTTGHLIEKNTELQVTRFESGPLGGDMQAGAWITEGKLDMVLFFWDPLAAHPHDPDVKALLRVAIVWNVPLACNRSTADFLITSNLFSNIYEKQVIDYSLKKEI